MMRKTLKRLKSSGGETFVEVLVGVLIISISSALFLNMVQISENIAARAREADQEFYRSMSKLELGETTGEGETPQIQSKSTTVTMQIKLGDIGGTTVSETYPAQVYYGNQMAAYQAETGSEDPGGSP